MKTFVAALMVSVGLAAALDSAQHGAKTVSLYSAPFNSSYILEGEKGGMTAAFENLAILAFRQENEMIGYLVPKGIKSIFDPANVDLLPLKKFLYSDAPKVALTLSAAELLEIPEMSLAMPKLHLPAYNLDITFHVDQGSTQYPYILFLHKGHVHPGNHYTLDHLTLLGDFSFSDDLVKIDNDYVPDFMKPLDKRVSETHPC